MEEETEIEVQPRAGIYCGAGRVDADTKFRIRKVVATVSRIVGRGARDRDESIDSVANGEVQTVSPGWIALSYSKNRNPPH